MPKVKRVGRILGRVGLLLSTVAFTLATVSSPLIPFFSFFTGSFEDDIQIYLGAFGGCVVINNVRTCPAAKFGYGLSLENFPGRQISGPDPMNEKLTYAFVLFPICAFFSLLALGIHSFTGRRGQVVATIFACLSLVCGIAVTAIMFLLFGLAGSRINTQFNNNPTHFGTAAWIALVGAVLLVFSALLLGGSIQSVEEEDRPLSYQSDDQPLVKEYSEADAAYLPSMQYANNAQYAASQSEEKYFASEPYDYNNSQRNSAANEAYDYRNSYRTSSQPYAAQEDYSRQSYPQSVSSRASSGPHAVSYNYQNGYQQQEPVQASRQSRHGRTRSSQLAQQQPQAY